MEKRRRLVNWLVVFVLLCGVCVMAPSYKAEAALTQEQEQALREDLREWMLQCDVEAVLDVSQYNLDSRDFYINYNDVKDQLIAENIEFSWFCKTDTSYMPVSLSYKTEDIIDKVGWKAAEEDANFQSRYEEVIQKKNEILSGITSEMTDLDKIIYLNNWYVQNTSYSLADYEGFKYYNPVRLLLYGTGACSSYADSMKLFLDELGIENQLIYAENHVWNMIKYENEWYQADITWNRSRNGVHKYLMMNDTRSAASDDHYPWWTFGEDSGKQDPPACTSTAFDNWFAYSVSKVMTYYNGYWYYSQDKVIYRAKADASEAEVFIEADGGITSFRIVDGIIIYTAGNEESYYDLDASKEFIDEDNLGWKMKDSLLQDADSWRLGQYNTTDGGYVECAGKVCLKSKVSLKEGKYIVDLASDDYKVTICEYGVRGNLIGIRELEQGDIYEKKENVIFLGVTISNKLSDSMTLEQYQHALGNGLFSFHVIMVSLDKVNEKNFDNWQSGNYHHDTGVYTKDSSRACMKHFVHLEDGKYVISISNASYHVLIREYSEDGSKIGSYNLANEAVYEKKAKVSYISISLYNIDSSSVNVEDYKELIEGGALSIAPESDIEEKVPEITGVILSEYTLNMCVTETKILKATVMPCGVVDGSVIWSSSDESVATIDADGKVVALKEGNVTILATTTNGKMAECQVLVSKEENSSEGENNPTEKEDTTKDENAQEVKDTNNKNEIGGEFVGENNKDGNDGESNDENTKEPICKGDVIKDKKGLATYLVVKVSDKMLEVSYKNPVDRKKSSVVIPSTVELTTGQVAKVVAVEKNAFKKNKKLKKVTIGKNVKKIGSKAFYGCKNLKMVKIKTTKLAKKNVGSKAWKGIHKKAVIKVPKSKLKYYKKMLKEKGIGKKVTVKKL